MAVILKCSPAELKDKVQRLVEQTSRLEKELKAARLKKATGAVKDWKKEIQDIAGVPVYVEAADIQDRKAMGDVAESRLKEMGSGVVIIGSAMEDKVAVSGAASKDLVSKKVHVGNIIKAISEDFGGKGGGRPDFAQGGGKDVEKFKEFVEIALKDVEKKLREIKE
jgi:alanyl-tRNA synthetase